MRNWGQWSKQSGKMTLLASLGLALAALQAWPQAVWAAQGVTECELRLKPLRSQKQRALEEIKRLRVVTYNTLNLKYNVGKHARGERGFTRVKEGKNKDQRSIEGVATAIQELGADIYILQEIEGKESLESFAREELGDVYEPILITGNDERGIQVGFLVKRDLPFDIEVQTHKHETWNDPTLRGEEVPLYARDVPVLIIRSKGAPKGSKPLLIVAGGHEKSQRDRPRDPRSVKKRTAEVARDVEIFDEYDSRWDGVPMIMGKDWNNDIGHKISEFRKLLADGKRKDVLDLIDPVPSYQDRITHTYHPKGGKTEARQMDALVANEPMQGAVLDAGVYRYKDDEGNPKPIPQAMWQRKQNPSDHFPVWVDLDFTVLMQIFGGQSAQGR